MNKQIKLLLLELQELRENKENYTEGEYISKLTIIRNKIKEEITTVYLSEKQTNAFNNLLLITA